MIHFLQFDLKLYFWHVDCSAKRTLEHFFKPKHIKNQSLSVFCAIYKSLVIYNITYKKKQKKLFFFIIMQSASFWISLLSLFNFILHI